MPTQTCGRCARLEQAYGCTLPGCNLLNREPKSSIGLASDCAAYCPSHAGLSCASGSLLNWLVSNCVIISLERAICAPASDSLKPLPRIKPLSRSWWSCCCASAFFVRHCVMASTKELLEAAFQDWDVEELDEYEKELSEGSGHNGISALIGMIARKPSSA